MIAQNRVTEAIEASRALIAANPGDPDAHVLLSNALLRKGRIAARPDRNGAPTPIARADADAAAAELEAAIKLSPLRKDVYLGLIDVWTAAADDDAVLKQVRRTAAQFPGDFKVMNGLLDYGFERQIRNDPLAGPILEAVHGAYPAQPDAILAWASFLLNHDDLDRSRGVLEAGTKSAPGNATLLESLGDAHCYGLDFEGAAKQYSRASTIEPKLRAVRLKWAATLHILDPKSALVVLDQLNVDAKSGGRVPTMQLGKDGKGQSRTDRGAAILLRLLNDPDLSAIDTIGAAKGLWAIGLAPESLAETQVGLLKDPVMVEAFMLRAEILTRAGLDTQAAEALARADASFDAAKGRSFAYSRDEVARARGETLARLGRDEEALAAYGRATDTGRVAFAMAKLAEKLGRTDEARALFEKAAASSPVPAEAEAAKSRLQQAPYRAKP